jgi:hypothetical protein
MYRSPRKKSWGYFIILLTSTSFLLSICSCNLIKDGHIIEGKAIVINLDSEATHLSISDFVDSLKTIELQTTDSSVISDAFSVNRIIVKDNKYFVLDDRYMSVKAFDSTGRFLFSVGKLGVGKGQFSTIEDLQYYSPHGSLMVLCTQPRKLAEFDLNGKLLREQPLDFWATGVAFPSDNSRIFYINQNKSEISADKNVLLTDSNNTVNARLFDLPKNITVVDKISGGLYSTGSGNYFNPAYTNTYYSITTDTAAPVISVNYGARNIPPGIKESDLYQNLTKFGFQNNTFVKTNSFIGFNYHGSGRSAAFVDLRSGKLITSNVQRDSLNSLFTGSVFDCDGRFIMVLDVNRLPPFLKRNADLIHKRYPDFHAALDTKKLHRNPVLLLFALKPILN